eukprot:s516_g12.t3
MRTTLSTWSVISLRNWHDAAWTTKTKTVQAVTTASWALSNLLAESPEAIEHVCSIGGMSTAVALLKSSVSCHEHACQYLCRLICGLGGGPSLAARRGRRRSHSCEEEPPVMALQLPVQKREVCSYTSDLGAGIRPQTPDTRSPSALSTETFGDA